MFTMSKSLTVTLRVWLKIYQSLLATVRPAIDLGIRLLIAQSLFGSALLHTERGAPLLGLGGLAAGLLLSAGLLTRVTSLAVLIPLVVAQSGLEPTDTRLFQIATLSWLFVHGAGGFSLDILFSACFTGRSTPLVRQIVRATAWLDQRGQQLYLAALRMWMAASWLVIGIFFETGQQWAPILPVNSLAIIPPGFAILGLLLAFVGVAMIAQLILLVGGILTLQAIGLVAGLEMTGIDPLAVIACALLAFHGGGYLSIDRAIGNWLQANILFERRDYAIPADWPHVVLVGAGFAGLACAGRLARLPVRVTLIDRQNYHLFQPLLYQIATASLSPADVASPIRSLFRGDRNVTILMGEVSGVDMEGRTVQLHDRMIAFDTLILATGARHSYFGRDDWAPFAPGLKRVEDGVRIRGHILRAFERAETANSPEEQRRLLTFVIVGGGPTGVELAGAIAEMAAHGLRGDFRSIDPAASRIILLHAGDRLLPTFPEPLSEEARRALTRLGVDVRVGARVT